MWENCYVDAVVSRQLSTGFSLVQEYQERGELREFVIIALGNNGIHSFERFFTNIIEGLNPGHSLIFVTPFDGRDGWKQNMDTVSAWLRELPNHYYFVSIADWNAAVRDQTHLLAADRVHMGGAASRNLYAEVILGALVEASQKPVKGFGATGGIDG
jgi:hypothetical protein